MQSCADMSVVGDILLFGMFVDAFYLYDVCLLACQRMEVDASLGEVEVMANGSMCM